MYEDDELLLLSSFTVRTAPWKVLGGRKEIGGDQKGATLNR